MAADAEDDVCGPRSFMVTRVVKYVTFADDAFVIDLVMQKGPTRSLPKQELSTIPPEYLLVGPLFNMTTNSAFCSVTMTRHTYWPMTSPIAFLIIITYVVQPVPSAFYLL